MSPGDRQPSPKKLAIQSRFAWLVKSGSRSGPTRHTSTEQPEQMEQMEQMEQCLSSEHSVGMRSSRVLTAVILSTGYLGFIAPAAKAADPSVRVKVEVRGTQRTGDFRYQYEIFCARTNGAAVQNSEGKDQLKITVGKGETLTVGTKEFPSLTLDDSCWIRSTADDGSETTYTSSNGTRADGSVRDASPGLISGGGYRSAPALASSELITATQSYTGDLVVTNRVDGIPANGTGVVPVSIRCDNQGISRTLNLSDGDRELITGIPTGSSCRVSTLAGRSRTEDNSGSPSDGVVVISPIRPECLDLRNASPDCRATVTVTTAYEPALDPSRVADPNESTTTAPTTTNPDDANRQNAQPAQAAPATAAPAVAPSPAVAVDATPTFSG